MIAFDEAHAIVLQKSTVLGTRVVLLHSATGEVLAENITAPHPIPLFDSSSMDGFALHSTDLAAAADGRAVTLSVAGTIHAGKAAELAVGRRSAIRIMTGAKIPHGADAVIMKELVTETEDAIEIRTPIRKGANIRRRGAEFIKDAVILNSGTLVTPPVAGLIATSGRMRVRVYKKPRVALVITGDEVRPPTAKLKEGQIRDANSPALASALTLLGIDQVNVSHAADNRSDVSNTISDALRTADVVITVGGISVGDHDYVRETLRSLRVEEHFWRIAMKPGKPNYFGTRGKKMVFGLPGNPVSALISFHVLVRPAISSMMGRSNPEPLVLRARLTTDLKKQPGRMEFVRIRISNDSKGELTAEPLPGQESHMLSSLSSATGIFRFSRNATSVRKGRTIPVELLDWGLT